MPLRPPASAPCLAAGALLLAALAPAAAATLAPATSAGEGFLVRFHDRLLPGDLGLLQAAGLHPVHVYHAVPLVFATGTLAASHAAAASARVARVEPDRPIAFHLADSAADVGARPGRTPGALEALGLDGAGVAIAVVDSGIDATHPDLPFGAKVVQNVKLVQPVVGGPLEHLALADTDLASGHGTHVAAIAAGSGAASGGVLRGVAPGAALVGVGIGEAGRMWVAAAGLDWVWRNAAAYGIRVVTNSWGPVGGSDYDPQGAVELILARLHQRGLVVVFSVGNDGLAADGQVAWDEDRLSGLAMSPHAIGVTSHDPRSLHLADTASRGDPARAGLAAKDGTQRRPDLSAPGEHVTSAAALLSGAVAPAAPRVPGGDQYLAMSGTSMAAPHVAGAAALVVQALERRGCPATPEAVRAALLRTARAGALRDGLGTPGAAFDGGHGALDAFAAAQLALAAPGCDTSAAPVPPALPSSPSPVRGQLHVYQGGEVDPWAATGTRRAVAPGLPVALSVRFATGLDPGFAVGPATRGWFLLAPASDPSAPVLAVPIASGAAEPVIVGTHLRSPFPVQLPALPGGDYVLRAWLDAGPGGAWLAPALPLRLAGPP